MKKIWGNMVVKNEDKFIWFAVKSVIEFLDKLIIYDTGSSDKTVEIIELLKKEYPRKIIFEEIGEVDGEGLTKVRQKMLDETLGDWFLIVDGDEIWWRKGMELVLSEIEKNGNGLYALVSPVYNLVGDVYHYQEKEAGEYKILGKKGHFNIRVINRHIPGLHLGEDYPLEGYIDKEGRLIQSVSEKLKFVDTPVFHASHLRRSSLNTSLKKTLHRDKLKFEIGNRFPNDFKFPEVFYLERPEIVDNPWIKMSLGYQVVSFLQTPLRKIKRRFLKG